ncbi:zinc-binding domain-containing protein [Cercophora samala]|uniref:Zinc-binding domain-containing protein n=1 Tax=Cercophora samala TaxID=330535 RepID=A0AA39YWH8_9PEZI|nr:zinc-binding domain-containing protein [Cercophora samala]
MSSNAEQTFPQLHDAVLDNLNNILELKPYFKEGSNQVLGNCREEYSTFVMANFTCQTPRCSKRGWRSGKVTILIRGYENNGYHATVFNQQCERCKKLGILELDQSSYIDRVLYRLKRWGGVSMEIRGSTDRKEVPPHKTDLCEGGERGYCKSNSPWWACYKAGGGHNAMLAKRPTYLICGGC